MSKRCPYCAEEIQDAAIVCRYCGRDLVAQNAPIASGATTPQKPAKKGSGCTSFLLIMLFLFVGLVVLIAVTGRNSRTATPTHDDVGAWVITQRFVKDRLISPATAEFPCCSDDFVTHLGEGRYKVKSYVDAENRFGAKLRMNFEAVVLWLGNDRWRLESIDLNEP